MNKSIGRDAGFFEMSVSEIDITYARFKERFALSLSSCDEDNLLLKVYKDMLESAESQAYIVAFFMHCWGVIPNKLLQKLIGNEVCKMPAPMYYERLHHFMVKYLHFSPKKVNELLEGIV